MRNDKQKLDKILECIDRILDFTSGGEKAFFSTPLIQDAVIRNFQVIGEAVKELSVELKEKYPDVEWRLAARMRDRIIHEYFDVNYEIVWDTIENYIPLFRSKIEDIHRRLIYKVTDDGPSELRERLENEYSSKGN